MSKPAMGRKIPLIRKRHESTQAQIPDDLLRSLLAKRALFIDTHWKLFRQAGHAQSNGLLGALPAARLRDEQIYRPFRREHQIWRGQPSKGSI